MTKETPHAVGASPLSDGLDGQIDLFGIGGSQKKSRRSVRRRDYDAEAKALLEEIGIFNEPKEVQIMVLAKLLADELPTKILQTAFMLNVTDNMTTNAALRPRAEGESRLEGTVMQQKD